jgi:WD40 repeat protein
LPYTQITSRKRDRRLRILWKFIVPQCPPARLGRGRAPRFRIFRLNDKKEVRAIESPCPWARALTFTPSGEQIVAGLSDASIVIWDAGPTDEQQRRSKAE